MGFSKSKISYLLGIVGAVIFFTACVASGAVFTVNSVEDAVDSLPGDGTCRTISNSCSLRAAIQEANASASDDEIVVPRGVYVLTLQGRAEDAAATGDLDVTSNLTITGAGPGITIIDGARIDRVFHIDPAGTLVNVTMRGVTIQNGQTIGIAFVTTDGGGILLGPGGTQDERPRGSLRIVSSVVQNNETSFQFGINNGGGIAVHRGNLSLSRVLVKNNATGRQGGGVFNLFGTIDIADSTIEANIADEGGGLINFGFATIRSSTIDANRGGRVCGGVQNARGTLNMANSTISSNIGVGLCNFGQADLNNATIVSNNQGTPQSGGAGGGISNDGTLTLSNTIVAGNINAGTALDCTGTLTSRGYNLIQNRLRPNSIPPCLVSGDETGNIYGLDPRLGLLANNGGATSTHALLAASPAVGAGSPTLPGSNAGACAATDQRGIARPAGDRCDIGAFELGSGFSISGVRPDHGTLGASNSILVYGSGMANGAVISLRCAGRSIRSSVTTIREGGSVAAASFDLSGSPVGACDVIATNPGGTSATRVNGFSIRASGSHRLWIDVVGGDAIRAGRDTRYLIWYGNNGDADAYNVPVIVTVSKDVDLGLTGPVAAPPFQAGQVATDWSAVGVRASSNARFFVPLLVPVVPSGSSGTIEFHLRSEVEGDFEMGFGIGEPFDQEAIDPVAVTAMVEGAVDYARTYLGTVVPSTRLTEMRRFQTQQFRRIAESGRQAWIQDLGGKSTPLSISHLLIDLAQFAVQPFASLRRPAFLAAPGSALPDADCTQLNKQGGVLIQGQSEEKGTGTNCVKDPPKKPKKPIKRVRSIDPNMKAGPTGHGRARYFVGHDPLRYTVFFENLASATAPAQEIIISDQLDPATMDFGSFGLGTIAFGAQRLFPPAGLSEFDETVDLRPGQNLLVRVNVRLDPVAGRLMARLSAVDPVTLQRPANPLLGVLPPNRKPPEGEGFIAFVINAKPIVTGTRIVNTASIVFDDNAPILTPAWTNTIDKTPPTSHVLPLAATQSSSTFPVRWAGVDVGAGIESYDVYVSENGGAFRVWLTSTSSTAQNFVGKSSTSYAFYSVARDQVGNVEAPPRLPDATTRVAPSVRRPGDLDGDGDVDTADLTILIKNLNKPVADATCGTSCDLDGSGRIDALDARKLQLLCTRPRCATQ